MKKLISLALIFPVLTLAADPKPLESRIRAAVVTQFGLRDAKVDIQIVSSARPLNATERANAQKRFDVFYKEFDQTPEAVLGEDYPAFEYSLRLENNGDEEAVVHFAPVQATGVSLNPLYFALQGFQKTLPAKGTAEIRFVSPGPVGAREVGVRQALQTKVNFDLVGGWRAALFLPLRENVPVLLK